MDSLIGQTLDGRYLVETRIGEGAMGSVYKARHIAMAQPVALKFLLTDRANDPSMVERFIREARQSFHIDHPNCVRVTDFCATEDGTLFIVMDYLDGRTVGREIAIDGPISSTRVRHIAAQAADALDHAHSLGLVHRDLKPDNMMLLQRGGDCDFTKVFDFGLAKLFDQGMMLTGLSLSPLTQDGIVFGTPVYMAPEQALGGDIGPASDMYTLGVCCYEMLTGTVPFEAGTFTAILSMHVQKQAEPPSQRRPDLNIDPQLEDLVMACLRKDASERPTASELAQAMRSGSALVAPTKSQELTNSETLILDGASLPPSAGSPPRASLPPSFSTASVAVDALAFQRPRRRYLLAALPVACLLVLVAWSLLRSPADASQSDDTAKAALSVAQDASPSLDDASLAAPEDVTLATPVPAVGKADAGTAASKPNTNVRPRSNAHLAAAEAAYRSQQVLKQLTEANAALEAEPRNRRAAFLAGDALQKSGDKVRACRFFKRSSKKHYRANGCEN